MMLKIVKGVVIALAVLVAVLVFGGMLLSPKFSLSRSVLVNAAPDRVYPLIADPRAWARWSEWNRRDPAMHVDYSGAASGAGAKWAWKSDSEGDGEMSLTAAEPDKRVVYALYFPDFGTTSEGELLLLPEAGGTRVSWSMNGDMGHNPLFHWMALFADDMVGKDFDAGLARLKALAESPP
jgi:uncharacterized protein YndB with AHSA1/START domain